MTVLSKERLRLWLRLLKVTRLVEAELREKLRREHGSTLPRFDVMAALARHPGGLRMSGLSGVLRVSNGNVTGIVDRLAAEGLVERRAAPGDRRATIVCLTEAGRGHFAELAIRHEGWVDRLFGGLDAGETESAASLLDRIARGVEEAR
jgi:DNA-binding MarR family transcriptional regulator